MNPFAGARNNPLAQSLNLQAFDLTQSVQSLNLHDRESLILKPSTSMGTHLH